MAEKSEKVNLILTESLWERLRKVSAQLGYGRAAFIRLVLTTACDARDPSIFVPRKAQGWMGMQPARAPVVPMSTEPSRTESLPPGPSPSPPQTRRQYNDTAVCLQCFAMAESGTRRCPDCSGPMTKPYAGPRGNPLEHDIPDEWVDGNGSTWAEQREECPDDDSEYRPTKQHWKPVLWDLSESTEVKQG